MALVRKNSRWAVFAAGMLAGGLVAAWMWTTPHPAQAAARISLADLEARLADVEDRLALLEEVLLPGVGDDPSPDQVVDELQAALADKDWEAVASYYAEDAFVIDDQGVLVGPDEIVAALQSLDDLSDGAPLVVTEQLPFRDVVRVLFWLDAGWFGIPDGVITYHIEGGQIVRETRHGLIEFFGPPPE